MSLEIHEAARGDAVVLGLAGDLTLDEIPAVRSRVRSARAPSGVLEIDVSRVGRFDAAGVGTLIAIVADAHARGRSVRVTGVGPVLADYMRRLDVDRIATGAGILRGERSSWLESLGESAIALVSGLRDLAWLTFEIVYWAVRVLLRSTAARWGALASEVTALGWGAVPIVSLVALLIGVTLGIEAARQLRALGAGIYVADLVGVALTRNIGPLVTAIVMAGRSGSSIAAEVGTMVVTEETDGLRMMGISPIRYVVVPKLAGLVVAMPCLTVLTDVVGIAGGMLVARADLGLPYGQYLDETRTALELSDIVAGLAKAMVFAVLIGGVACYRGLAATGGAGGVGRVTTSAVVLSILLIILANALFTAIL